MSSIEGIGGAHAAGMSRFNALFNQYMSFNATQFQEEAASLKDTLKEGQVPEVRRIIDNLLACNTQTKGTLKIQIQTVNLIQNLESSSHVDLNSITSRPYGCVLGADCPDDTCELKDVLASIVGNGVDSLAEVCGIISILGALGGINLGPLAASIKTALEEFSANVKNILTQSDFSTYMAFVSTLEMIISGHASTTGLQDDSAIFEAVKPNVETTPVSATEPSAEADVQSQQQEAPKPKKNDRTDRDAATKRQQETALLRRREQMGFVLTEEDQKGVKDRAQGHAILPVKEVDQVAQVDRRVTAIDDLSRSETAGTDKGYKRASIEDHKEGQLVDKEIVRALENIADEYSSYFMAGMLSILHLLPKVQQNLEGQIDTLLTEVDDIQSDMSNRRKYKPDSIQKKS